MSITERINRFSQYNISRKIKAIKFHEDKASFLFKIIPFLLHVNSPDLPGYIEDASCPYGIHRFSPQKIITRELFNQYFPESIALKKDSPTPFTSTPVIHSLKTIGSIGTIAQTFKSDCDYWVSIREAELGDNGRQYLEEKCRAIESWASSLENEIYFFLMDIDQTRENSFESRAEDESAGSALKLLLKDELFRTHIQVAGKMLLWWLIPPGLSEDDYRRYVMKMADDPTIDLNNFVDLGYISDIPKSEIFGACLWQMNKALVSPFKSIIKFAYLELLLNEKKNNLRLLSDRIKILVTFPGKNKTSEFENLKLADIDPYLLLAREIVAFYQREEVEHKQDEFIRICFFLKTLEGIDSQERESAKISHLLKLTDLMEEWNVLPQNVDFYLKFKQWKIKDLIDLGSKVHDYLSETYNRLRTIFRSLGDEASLTITEHDISVLGRKLFTFREKKPHKIEFVKGLSSNTLIQDNITIHTSRFAGIDYFFAFQGEYDHVSIKEKTSYIIKRETHLIRLLVWLIINRILIKETKIKLTKTYLPINMVDIKNLLDQLLETFPIVHFSHIPPEDLLKNEVIVKALAIINFSKSLVRGSKTLQTTIISKNCYGEYFLQDYTTLTQYKNALTSLLTKHYVSRWNKNLIIYIPNQQERHLLNNMLSS